MTILRHQAFLDRYTGEGVKEMEFIEAENNVNDFVSECQLYPDIATESKEASDEEHAETKPGTFFALFSYLVVHFSVKPTGLPIQKSRRLELVIKRSSADVAANFGNVFIYLLHCLHFEHADHAAS